MSNMEIWVKRLLPSALLNSIRPTTNMIRSQIRAIKRSMMKRLSVEDLASDLASIGIDKGDTLMVHSAMSSIGSVEDGAEPIIKSFLSRVDSDGTIMMPCYNAAEDVELGMREGRFVDLRTLKSNMGKITEVFRTWPGVARSSHPFSSVCVLGERTDHIISGHVKSPNICHAESPMAHIVENNVKIVGIGVSIAVGMAVSHYIEDTDNSFPIEVHSPPFMVEYIDQSGKTVKREVVRYDPAVSANRIGSKNTEWINEKMTQHFTRLGIMRWFQYGQAKSWVMEAEPVYQELLKLAKKGITIYLTEQKWKSMNAGDGSIESW